jgi:hypothetical protein
MVGRLEKNEGVSRMLSHRDALGLQGRSCRGGAVRFAPSLIGDRAQHPPFSML